MCSTLFVSWGVRSVLHSWLPTTVILIVGATAAPPVHATVSIIALTDGLAPEGNGQFASFGGFPLLNSGGQVVTWASLGNTSGGTIDDSGIYLHDGNALLNLARENGSLPEGNGRFAAFDSSSFAFNSAGQTAFWASLRNTSGGSLDDVGVYLHNGTTLVNIARENGLVPEGNGQFSTVGGPVINSSGRVTFDASLRNTSGSFNDDSGIYLHNGSTLLNRAREALECRTAMDSLVPSVIRY